MKLHEAARSGDLGTLRDRIAAGEPVAERDGDGRTPLMVAAGGGGSRCSGR